MDQGKQNASRGKRSSEKRERDSDEREEKMEIASIRDGAEGTGGREKSQQSFRRKRQKNESGERNIMEERNLTLEETMQGLQEEIWELEEKESALRQDVQKDADTVRTLREEVLEAKIHRIAMQEITNCSWEELLRSMGYVESFYGYPDMAKTEAPDKEEG